MGEGESFEEVALVVEGGTEGFDGASAGFFALDTAPHTIGDDKKPIEGIDEIVVFVFLANLAEVGTDPSIDLKDSRWILPCTHAHPH